MSFRNSLRITIFFLIHAAPLLTLRPEFAPPAYKCHTSKSGAYEKSDHSLTITKSQWIWNKYIIYEKTKITSNSETYESIS